MMISEDEHLLNNHDVTVDYDDYQYGAECSNDKRDSRGVCRRRVWGTALLDRANNITLRRACGDREVCSGNGGFTEAAAWGAGRASFANGFARTFERLDDQEAGYAEFVGFLVRVLDQMP